MRTLAFLSAGLLALSTLPAQAASDANPPSSRPSTTIDTANYVVVKDGHLSLRGQRVRFWGAIGSFPAGTYEGNVATVKRLKGLGFNMVRYWADPAPYQKGDKSRGDLVDHFIWCCAEEGMHIWHAGLNGLGEATAGDVSVINDPATADTWKKAVAPEAPPIQKIDTAQVIEGIKRQRARRNDTTTAITAQDIEAGVKRWIERQNRGPQRLGLRDAIPRYWDPRLHALAIKRQKAILDHVNQHTGYRYADDPVFAVWELTNEEWWFHRVKSGSFMRTLPDFFRQELTAQWNRFLKRKYASDAALSRAWIGNLLPGESLSKATVKLLPFYGTVRDAQAISLGVNQKPDTTFGDYSRSDFSGKRGGDVIEFLLSVWISGKQGEADSVKARGIGVRLAPLVWDNGIGYDLQTQYMQQHADAISHDSYFNGAFQTDPHHKRFPWMSQLEELPKVSWQDPWLEHNRMEGKPFFVYETQIMQPAKYRAEYPMSIAKLAAIQDWDVVCWHYWGHPRAPGDSLPFSHALDYATRTHGPQGYHFQFDEVQQSAMTAAAAVFVNGLLKPAPNPTTFIIGRRSLYNWEMNDYGRFGESFLPTVYRYGMRLLIDPKRERDDVTGPYFYARGVYEACPIVPTEEIAHDWQKGTLTFDAPGVKMFAGFMANHGPEVRFNDKVTLSTVRIANPKGMPYPVTEKEKYLEFCLVSTDGQPLNAAKSALISLVSTSLNSGFRIDPKKFTEAPWSRGREWHWNQEAIDSLGSAPVLVARVGARVTAPGISGMSFRMLDWHLRVVRSGVVSGGYLDIPETLPVFLVELRR